MIKPWRRLTDPPSADPLHSASIYAQYGLDRKRVELLYPGEEPDAPADDGSSDSAARRAPRQYVRRGGIAVVPRGSSSVRVDLHGTQAPTGVVAVPITPPSDVHVRSVAMERDDMVRLQVNRPVAAPVELAWYVVRPAADPASEATMEGAAPELLYDVALED
jgi:hypothetical protein